MASENRTDALKRLHACLLEKFRPTVPAERTVLEHFLYATCLEDATYEAADAAYEAIVHTMSGWNEVRVSSVTELAELMSQLPDPRGAAQRLKRILHAIFEEKYAFDLSEMQKKNAKESYEKLEKIPGATPFSVTYTCQVALGRHGIPLGASEKRVLYILGIIPESEVELREIAGLNRAIAKQDGIKFASLLHKLTATFVTNPESRKVTSFFKSFSSDYRTRMPKRRAIHEEDTMETPVPAAEEHRVRMIDILTSDPDFAPHSRERTLEDKPALEEQPPVVKEASDEKKKGSRRPVNEVAAKVPEVPMVEKTMPSKKPVAKKSVAAEKNTNTSKGSRDLGGGKASSSEPPADSAKPSKGVPAKAKGAMMPTGKPIVKKGTAAVRTSAKETRPVAKKSSFKVENGTKSGKASKSAKK